MSFKTLIIIQIDQKHENKNKEMELFFKSE